MFAKSSRSLILFLFVLVLVLISVDTAQGSVLIGENRQGYYIPTSSFWEGDGNPYNDELATSNYDYDLDVVYEVDDNDMLMKQVFIRHLNDPFVRTFDGTIDETYLVNGGLSSAWISAMYANQSSPSVFFVTP